jgi:hypothetical protein
VRAWVRQSRLMKGIYRRRTWSSSGNTDGCLMRREPVWVDPEPFLLPWLSDLLLISSLQSGKRFHLRQPPTPRTKAHMPVGTDCLSRLAYQVSLG